MFRSNHGSISHRFRDRRRFQSKIVKKSSHPREFCAPAEWVSLGIEYRRTVSKSYSDGASGRTRSLTISLDVWIQCTNVTGGHRRTAKTALTRSVVRVKSAVNKLVVCNLHFTCAISSSFLITFHR